MKIYVLGSNAFVKDMVGYKDRLCALGYDGWIHQDYEDHVNGKAKAFIEGALPGESAEAALRELDIEPNARRTIALYAEQVSAIS